MKKILFIIGTRPDAIKCAPLIKELKKIKNKFDVKVCSTGQHKEMLEPVLAFFEIKVDFDLKVMVEDQTIINTITSTLKGLNTLFTKFKPDYVIVQGDANPSISGSLAAYYSGIKIIHLEAGLRSGNKKSPFPEEGNRILTSHLADIHFAPTLLSKMNLKKEGIIKNVFVVGNTVVDALLLAKEKILKEKFVFKFNNKINFNKKIILITGHRRESFGKPLENILLSVKKLAESHPELEFVYPVHLNPNVKKPVENILSGKKNIHLIPPVNYPEMVYLMDKSNLIITDSGGVQEEAPSFGKPILVTREVTERSEGIDSGAAVLVGSDKNKIIATTEKLLINEVFYKKMSQKKNPYGDGQSSKKITSILLDLI